MWRENDVVLISSRPSTSSGAFGIPGETMPNGRIECQKWETCRDRFYHNGAKLNKYWYRVGQQSGESISAFFDKIETRLKIKKKSRFGPTSCNGAIWVQWAPFWKKYSMRRSLFTALLRVSLGYDRHTDNYEEALTNANYTYIRQTRVAFDYFMEGNTIYTGAAGNGWYVSFNNRTLPMLTPLLRKPVKKATA